MSRIVLNFLHSTLLLHRRSLDTFYQHDQENDYTIISVSVSTTHTDDALRCRAGHLFVILMVLCMAANSFGANPTDFSLKEL